jgi:hypothetical protein
MVYRALLPLMCTPRLPVIDGTDVPADLNGLVFSPKDEIWFLRVRHHILNAVCHRMASLYLGHVISATLQGRGPVWLASCALDMYHVRILLCSAHVGKFDK